jgi:hypothetical protein
MLSMASARAALMPKPTLVASKIAAPMNEERK